LLGNYPQKKKKEYFFESSISSQVGKDGATSIAISLPGKNDEYYYPSEWPSGLGLG